MKKPLPRATGGALKRVGSRHRCFVRMGIMRRLSGCAAVAGIR